MMDHRDMKIHELQAQIAFVQKQGAARIEALEAALRRIDAINDSPARFSKDIHDVIAALALEQK